MENASEVSGRQGISDRAEPGAQPSAEPRWMRALAASELPEGHSRGLIRAGHPLALFNPDGGLFAVDTRCPHRGFPLARGSVKDCILTCHWHHARFDLNSGGTFDQWADDARVFPVRIEDGAVMVDVAENGDRRGHFLRRLSDGLERGIPLVIGKSLRAPGAGGDPGAGPPSRP